MSRSYTFSVHAPQASRVLLMHSADDQGRHTSNGPHQVEARHQGGGEWVAEVVADDGDLYWFEVDGVGPLLDPRTSDVVNVGADSVGVVRSSWPRRPSLGRHHADPIVYELHVRGFGGDFAGCAERLGYLSDLGINVIEVMPVHPFDSTTNYWGYMPLVWGAVHRQYAAGADAPEELAELIGAAHALDIEVWLDVVFNHTGEGDATMPARSLRGLDDAHAYLHQPDGSYNDDSGCGNVVNVADPQVRSLVLEALQRFADLGIDGFRFDLASLLTRDGGGLIAQIEAWARDLGVRLVAEPWDLAAYQVGEPIWPAAWLQWNDRFRDDVRGLLRGEPGLVAAVMQRVQGSPDLFDGHADRSVNFLTAHDGLTMHDLTTVTSNRHRSWDCGAELRLQQLQNYFTMLLLSAGTPMFVMGDEFARTQMGHDNPFDVDSEVTRVDWRRLDEWAELRDFVRRLLAMRRGWQRGRFRFHGTGADPDTSYESRSLAWCNGDLYVMVNAWWQPLAFEVHEPGEWVLELCTADVDGKVLQPRSIAVWRRRP